MFIGFQKLLLRLTRAPSSDWTRTADKLPERSGKYLCAVYLAPRHHGSISKRGPRRLYRVLDFDRGEGGFWLDNGMPGPGVTTHWTTIPKLPKYEMGPQGIKTECHK